ncbi:MAG: hypothetical protein KVP17_001728 [Porospora cf. gigantea B]|uniref:uncharacterized protein n=1 Tax=Porospora cf. gigantea B TaxID=2853592 RepID=UPI0035719DE5|nr:MAG: hypothetical protein KVP17_001728 [Porospora cf. gigantea B]
MGCDGLENPVWKAESCAALSTVQRLATAIETRTPYERLLAVSSAFHNIIHRPNFRPKALKLPSSSSSFSTSLSALDSTLRRTSFVAPEVWKPKPTTPVVSQSFSLPPGGAGQGLPPMREVPRTYMTGSLAESPRNAASMRLPSSKGPKSSRPPLIVKWLYPPARYVEVTGTFCAPKWTKRYPLYWCPKNGCHWLNLLEVVPGIQGSHQYKLIVDGQWRCDPFAPICDDASLSHNLNNFVSVLPDPIRQNVFASNQRRLSAFSQRSICSNASGGSVCGSSSASSPVRHGPAACARVRRAASFGLTEKLPQELSLSLNVSPTYYSPTQPDRRRSLVDKSSDLSFHEDNIIGTTLVAHPKWAKKMNRGREARLRYREQQKCQRGGRRSSSASGSETGDVMRRAVSLMRIRSYWPDKVLELLHSPDILLELNVPKNVLKATEGLELSIGACMIPHPDKRETGGADAFFCSRLRGGAMGISDGVGEWDRFDLDPRQFAEEMMIGAKNSFEKEDLPADSEERAAHMVTRGYNNATSFGSSTVIVACMNDDGSEVGIASLGDSSVIILRRTHYPHFQVVMRSFEQQHMWNCPYQLSNIPTEKDFPSLIRHGKEKLVGLFKKGPVVKEDTPSMCTTFRVPVEEGDLIIMGSDGLFDNLFDHEIVGLCNLCLSPREADALHDWVLHTPAQVLATALADAADFKSRDPGCRTPFAQNARKQGLLYSGGKLDDISVVVSWVCRGERAPSD